MPEFSSESNKKFEAGDFYYSPEGYMVFTEQYLLRRGYCCKSGCRHCPYGYDKKTDRVKSVRREKQ